MKRRRLGGRRGWESRWCGLSGWLERWCCRRLVGGGKDRCSGRCLKPRRRRIERRRGGRGRGLKVWSRRRLNRLFQLVFNLVRFEDRSLTTGLARVVVGTRVSPVAHRFHHHRSAFALQNAAVEGGPGVQHLPVRFGELHSSSKSALTDNRLVSAPDRDGLHTEIGHLGDVEFEIDRRSHW